MSAAFYTTLKKGETFKTEGVFQGVSDKSVKWTVEDATHGGGVTRVRIVGTYMGINIGTRVINVGKRGKVEIQ